MLFFAFILMCGFINLMIGSASAQWAVTAPIFVPMLMLVGYAPETIQAAYRIGDSTTNIITPMMSYFGLILAVATRYMKNLGIGTLIATMLPYSIVFIRWLELNVLCMGIRIWSTCRSWRCNLLHALVLNREFMINLEACTVCRLFCSCCLSYKQLREGLIARYQKTNSLVSTS